MHNKLGGIHNVPRPRRCIDLTMASVDRRKLHNTTRPTHPLTISSSMANAGLTATRKKAFQNISQNKCEHGHKLGPILTHLQLTITRDISTS